jgi:hypothetical protein
MSGAGGGSMSGAGGGSDDDGFERAGREERVGLFAELWEFLRYNKKWWMIPILIVLLGLGALILLSGTAAGPFIYALF